MWIEKILIPLTLFVLLSPIPINGKGGHWWNQDFREESDDYYNSSGAGVGGNTRNSPQSQIPYSSSAVGAGGSLQQNPNNNNQLESESDVIEPPTYESGTIRAQYYGGRRSRSKLKSNQQLIPVGDICDPTDATYSRCVENANCMHFETENLYKCNCSYSYEVSSIKKKCLRSWGQYCDAKDICTDFLKCINNRCECDNSAVYQDPSAKCQSRVGGPCSTNLLVGPECVPNAICLSYDRYGRKSRCVCKDGYIETMSGQCTSGVGMPCEGLGICNPELVCKEGMCTCRESVHVYDVETNSCVGLVGAQCCMNFDGVDCHPGVSNGCVSGAFCKKTSKNLPGRCACQSFNVESDDRTCSPNPTFGHVVPGKTY